MRVDEKLATASPVDTESNQALVAQVGSEVHIKPDNNTCLQMVHYIAQNSLPRLRKFLVDADKIATICQNIAYYIVTPATKGKARRVLSAFI